MAFLGVTTLVRRALAALTRSRRDRDLREEIEAHIEMRRQQLIDEGADPRDAASDARRLFGNVTAIRETTRDEWGFPSLDTLTQDLRYGLRVMAKSPGFTSIAVLSLVVSIGLSSAIFSVANALLFRPLPGNRSADLVQVFTSHSGGGLYGGTSYPDYEDLRDRADSFDGLLAFRRARATFGDGETRVMLDGALVSANYFDALGLRASRGRFFRAEENTTPGGYPVVVLGHDAWLRHLAADPRVIGRTIALNGHAFTVIGVGPPGFAGVSFDQPADFFVPAVMERVVTPGEDTLADRRARVYRVLGQLRPGLSMRQTGVSLRLLAARLLLAYPEAWRGTSGQGLVFTVLSERDARFAGASDNEVLLIFSSIVAGVGILLAIASVNVATVLLARAAARRKEIAIRLAMGASRRRVIRQLLTESALLAAIGGAGGLLVATWVAAAFVRWRPEGAPAIDLSLDLRIVAFAIGASLLTIVLFGLAPALQTTRPDVNAELKDASPALRIRFRFGLRDGLVVAQVAISVVLIAGALLMLRSSRAGRLRDPGFRREGVLTVAIDLSTTAGKRDAHARFFRTAVESVAGLPGVERAAFAALVPLDGSNITTEIELPGSRGATSRVDVNVVGAGYFGLLGIPVLQGREFLASDRDGAAVITLVNDTMARSFWQGDAVGRTFTVRNSRIAYQVVGVVGDVRHRSLSEPPIPMVFFSAGQTDRTRMSLHVRTAAPALAAGDAIARVLRDIDRAAGVGRVRTMTEYMDEVTMPQRVGGLAAAGAAGVELALAVMALYGVIAYSTARRTREIGLRIALGAPSGSVARLIMRDGLVLGGAGVALGTIAGLAAAPILGSLLIGVGPADPIAFATAGALLVGVAACASYVPARRAMRVDPSVALRAE